MLQSWAASGGIVPGLPTSSCRGLIGPLPPTWGSSRTRATGNSRLECEKSPPPFNGKFQLSKTLNCSQIVYKRHPTLKTVLFYSQHNALCKSLYIRLIYKYNRSSHKMSPFHDAKCNTFTDSSNNDSLLEHLSLIFYWKHVQINVFLFRVPTLGYIGIRFAKLTWFKNLWDQQIMYYYY